MSVTVITPPTTYSVSLDQAKRHLRVTDTSEDVYIQELIESAMEYIERQLSMSLSTKTLRLTLDGLTNTIELPRGPVQSITSFDYDDEDGVLQTMDPSLYTVDLTTDPQWIVKNANVSWPTVVSGINNVRIQYVAGFTQTTLPRDLKQAVYLLLDHWFHNRGVVVVGSIAGSIQLTLDALLLSYRRFRA